MEKRFSIFKQELKEEQDEEKTKGIIAKAMVDEMRPLASKEFAQKFLKKVKEMPDQEER